MPFESQYNSWFRAVTLKSILISSPMYLQNRILKKKFLMHFLWKQHAGIKNLFLQKEPTCFLKKFSIFAGWETILSSVVKTGTSPVITTQFTCKEETRYPLKRLQYPKNYASHIWRRKKWVTHLRFLQFHTHTKSFGEHFHFS